MPSETPKPPELPKLTSTITESKDGWRRDIQCDYSWEELDDVFPPDGDSLVAQLAKIVRADRTELAELREQVKQAANLLAVANDPDPLANRLRGIYQLEDGSSRSVARFVPPIQVVAAAEIDRLRNEVTQARNAALEEAMAVAAPYAAAHPIGMAILEKIESLKGS